MKLIAFTREILFLARALIWARYYFLRWKFKKFIDRKKSIDAVKTILHINTEDNYGGAARIAMDLVTLQREAGYNSGILVHSKSTDLPYSFALKTIESRKQHFLGAAEKYLQWQDFFKLASLSLNDNPLLNETDIVHLHNLHGGYFSYLALPIISQTKRIVWSIHDMHPITGHCAHSFDCDKWEKECGSCPYLNAYPALNKDSTKFIRKSKAMSFAKSELHIVALSEWMKEKLEKSILKQHKIYLIHNGIDTSIFKPKSDISDIRSRLNIAKDKTIVLFSANLGSNNPYKGGEYLNRMVEEYEQDTSILFIAAGNSKQIGYTKKNLLSLPFINSQNEMADIYNLADIYLYPTLADNCPLAVLEAMACGTPVLTFNTGGTPELVKHKETGYVASYRDYADLKFGFEWLINSKELRTELGIKAIDRVNACFTIQKMNEKYLELYKSIAQN
jgi:glycosyltransferase involved in cell wall biosynthesis